MRPDRIVLSRAAIASIAGTFLLMGLVVSAYGPLLEHLTQRFGVSLPAAGATISVHFTGALFGVLAGMRSLRSAPGRWTVIAAIVVMIAGFGMAAAATAWAVFLAAVFVIGLGFGALEIALNQLIAYSESRRRAALLNALNGAYSAGAVIGPIVVAAFAGAHLPDAYLGAIVLALLLIPGALGVSGRLPVASAPSARPATVVAVFVAAFVLYVGLENATGGWMTSHLESLGLRSDSAAGLTSGFWLAVVAGRLLVVILPSSVPEWTIVITGSAVAALALAAASIGSVAPVAYVVAGLAIAPIFPTGIVWLARLRPDDSGATAWLYPATAVGGIAGPAAIGVAVAASGVRWVPAVLAAVAVLMTAAFFVARATRSAVAARSAR